MKVDPIRNKEDIQNFKEAAPNERDRIMIEVGLNSGLRISDILKIQARDVTDECHIRIKEKKTDKTRKVKLNSKSKNLVKEYIEKNGLEGDDYLFQSRKGDNKPISETQAYRIIRDTAEKKAGLDINAGTHTLRKTFGYHHYKKYKDVAKLQAILNHSKPRETLDYIGITQEEVDESMEEMYL